MKLRRRAATAAPLSDAAAAMVLGGWAADPPSGPVDANVDDTIWDVLLEGEQGIIERWNAHEEWLRRLARRWGWEPDYLVDGRALWFGEYLQYAPDETP